MLVHAATRKLGMQASGGTLWKPSSLSPPSSTPTVVDFRGIAYETEHTTSTIHVVQPRAISVQKEMVVVPSRST